MIIAALATLVLGPMMFYVLSRFLSKEGTRRYPTGINDSIGDIIFLPLFNYLLFSSGIDKGPEFSLSLVLGILFTASYTYLDQKASYTDWSKPKHYNFGGYYHISFMLAQSILIIYGIITYHSNLMLWVAFSGYILTCIIQFIWKGRL